MEYPFIQSLIPQGEHFDSSAVGEGVWMSVQHFSAVEARGTGLIADAVAQQEAMNNATSSTNELTATILSLEAQAKQDSLTISSNVARITELENQVAEHGRQSSGSGTTLSTSEDPKIENAEVPSYASDSNAGNAWMDKRLKKKTA